MHYRPLGRTGLFVSELCFGAMTFGGEGYWKNIGQQGQSEADALVGRCLDAGINFFDTANVYSYGQSEELLGKALAEKRSQVVLATKVRGRMGPGQNETGLSRYHIFDSVHASLKRLGTDHIDLLQIHGYDVATPLEETLRALDDLVSQGKVRYLGASNLAAWQLMKALGLSDHRGLSRFESLQAYYSIAGRDLERELVPLMKDQQVGLMVWSPLAGGFLSGKYRRNAEGPEGARRTTFDFPPVDRERAYNAIDVMDEVAKETGTTVARVALAWLLHQPHVTTVILGAKTQAQLEDNLAASELRLSAEQLAKLDAVSKLPPEYPGWMVERQNADRFPPAR
ncbi:aldo/keto reductase [Corallococcus exiguus]|uniref:aldo/keto reductase n=1 Tax=Corallococcus TaxID=83461 RepID=UPI000EA37073|nr:MULTISPECIES: aldo/keto reductase [Corallococcus]RKI29509.1 aldo/keto reductase [Corallococcus sp. AB004]NNB91525.1 aldo/keto reductase [Corallococcus exiguus]NNC08558.1 aldo/keto reductase [Corallococcus exiguus]NPC52571.1 aldo/keto reductase [Corallococcus exiguus]NPC75933.1 aldo/keto reductase [Corallococcus exiguus]